MTRTVRQALRCRSSARDLTQMPRSTGFPPVAAIDARVLVLGSMPGRLSLEKQQYYAHPMNSFWRIMGRLFGAGPALAYEQRLEVLMTEKIAVWDVLRSCARPGSLDAQIEVATAVPNDFRRFFRTHTLIRQVFFNGGTAASLFRRKVLPALGGQLDHITLIALPSTSPAHAGRTFEEKLRAWRAVRSALVRR
jgi:hypoxanthine-DNA glycosylase